MMQVRSLQAQLRTWLDFYTSERWMLATIALSSVTGLLAIALGLRALGVAVATLVPWVPLLVRKLRGDWSNFGALALFETLVILQLAHFAEHVSQVIELHWLNWAPPLARGIIGELDIEPVHFWWNTAILFGATFLLFRYRRNKWLWASWLFSIWHEVEHVYLYFIWYLPKGISGHPGIFGAGGVIDAANISLPILTELGRADLHFWYNLFEIGLFVIAFIVETIAWQRRTNPTLTLFPHLSTRRRAVIALALVQIPVVLGLALVRTSPRTLSVPQNYLTIQSAIDAAPEWAIIHIAPGTYGEALTISKPLMLIGASDGSTHVVVNPETPAITVRNTHDVTLKQLTVEGGLYGILVEGSKAVQILDNRVRDATFAGIRISRAAANITGNQITHVSGPYGMGIELANTMSQPPSLIQNNLVADNTREGIILHNAMALIDKNTVMRNGLRGIAVTEMSMATVRGNSIVSNTDAGVYVVDNSMAEILANHVGDVRPGVTGNAFGIQAYYYAEVMLGDNSILVDAPNALVAGYNATIEKGGAP